MKCRYIYKNKHIFDNELELDDFLIERRKYESDYGDLVFSKEKGITPKLRTLDIIDHKIKVDSARLDALYEEAKRKAKGRDGEEYLEFRPPYIGVNKWLTGLRTIDQDTGEEKRLYPEFTDEYWVERKQKWTDPLRSGEPLYSEERGVQGRFTKDEIEVFFPGDTFEEKVNNARLLKTNDDPSKDETVILRTLMEKKWEKQNYVGRALHFVMETFFSKYNDEVNVYDLSNEAHDGLPSLKSYIKQQVQDKFRRSMGRNWSDDLLPGTVLDNMIDYADKVYEKMIDKFGEGCEFYPELRITGKIRNVAPKPGDAEYLYGIIDLLVVDKTGQIHIFDYKTSTKPYKDFNSAKKLAFYYQLATYGKLLKNYGLEYRTATIGILPITLTNFHLENREEAIVNPDDAHFVYNGVEYPDEIFKDITGNIFRKNRDFEETIIKNLDDYLPEAIIKDASSDHILEYVDKQMRIWFPEYGKIKTEDEIRKMIEDDGGFQQNADGKFVWKPKGATTSVLTANSEPELFQKVKKRYEDAKKTRAWMASKVADALQTAQHLASESDIDENGKTIKREINLTELIEQIDTMGLEDPTGTMNWFKENLMKYCNEDWEVVRNDAAEKFGMILVRNKTNKQQINVIKMSTSYLRYNRHIGGKDRNSLIGAFQPDITEKADNNSLMLQAVNGNIEMIEAMLVLNNIPSLFTGEYSGAIIGGIQVMNSWRGSGLTASNEELMYCWKKLNKYSKMIDQDNISTGRIRFAKLWQWALSEFNNAMQTNASFQLKNRDAYANSWSALDSCVETDVDTKIREITKIINTMEEKNKGLAEMQGDPSDPEVRLHNELLLALASLKGINFRQQLQDHDKWLEDKTYKSLGNGIQGTYLDNPGNLASETLNLITKQVMQGYQNVRYDMQEPASKLRQLTEKLKAHKNFGWLQKRVSNQTSLYENMIEKGPDGDLYFTDINSSKLDDVEREYLDYVLTLVNKNRYGDKYSDAQLERMKQSHNNQYYMLPLAMAEFESKAYGSNLMDALRDRLKSFNPKQALAEMQAKVEGIFKEDESFDKPDTLFSMNNMFSSGDGEMSKKDRIDYITSKGENYFEHNLEVLALKHKFAYSVQKNINKVFPTIKAAMASLAMQGYSSNKQFVQDREYLENYVKAKIKNQSLHKDDKAKETEQTLSKVRQVASFLSLAFSPVQGLYQTLQGLWQDISLIIRKPDGTQAFTFRNMLDAGKIVYKEMFHYSDTPTKCQLLNELMGVNDMDMNTYSEKLRTDRHGIYNLWNFAFKFTSRPDFYNRMTIIIAKMKADGVWDAYEVKDGKLVYNYKKDTRFSAYAHNQTGSPDYAKQKGLYIAIARQLVKEGVLNPDGTLFKIGDPLPTAYSSQEIESMKDLTDLIYGYYSHEKKSMIHSTWLGALYMQMRTYWSGKKNQYLAPGGVRLQGKWEQAVNEEGQPLFYQVRDGQILYDEEFTTEDTGIPAVQWKGQWQEGIFITLKTMLFDYGFSPEGWKEGWRATFDNEDDNIRTIRQANLKQFVIDLTLFFLIGGLIGGFVMGDWDKELQKEARESDGLGDAMAATAVHIATMSMTQSASDFAWWSSIGGPALQWSPFSFEFGSRFIGRWWNVIMGDPTFYDGITGSFAAGKQLKPLLECIRPDSED